MSERGAEPLRHRELALAEGMAFSGLLVLPKDARIDGHVSGEVIAHGSVEVGPKGVVEADLEVTDVVVYGRVRGGIRAHHAIALGPGAVVEGNLHAPQLSMAEGARVEGRCDCGPRAMGREDVAPDPNQDLSAS